MSLLILGFGNPAREDDGIGPFVVEEIVRMVGNGELTGVDAEADYQLTVEDSAAVATHEAVIFVDAAVEGAEPFAFTRITPRAEQSFSSHSVSPEGVLALAEELFGARRPGFLLAVRGYSFAMFCERMTEKAAVNAREAVERLAEIVRTRDYQAHLVG